MITHPLPLSWTFTVTNPKTQEAWTSYHKTRLLAKAAQYRFVRMGLLVGSLGRG